VAYSKAEVVRSGAYRRARQLVTLGAICGGLDGAGLERARTDAAPAGPAA
jgi:hypothetical protein